MITGYNTDVRHREVVFHVQTEDKGVSNPFIESLVYVGGQVLATRRASYAEILAEGKDEKEIIALMDHQHRTMIAAIRHGKLDARLAELEAGRRTGAHAAVEAPRVRPPTGWVPVSPAASATGERAVAVPAAAARVERTLDQVILEYLTSEADQEQLVLLLEEEKDLTLGGRATVALRASSSKSGAPIAGAQVSVRMISTVTEPRVLASGRTDDLGVLSLVFDIPTVSRGTSALIINAVSEIGRAELKHLL
ncbi:MAG TPA: hypothetical protein VIC28_13250 [Thermoanaerobaculia bacterium]